MNIFYIDQNPKEAAKMLSDQHIRKMQIESAQMCCTAHWETGSEAPYKNTHKNHPSTLWVRKSIKHYLWVVEHGLEICDQFEKRYLKPHKTKTILEWCKNNLPNIPNDGFTPPPQCMPDSYKMPNSVDAYRKFYVLDKVKIKNLSWKKLNNQPSWVN